MIAAGICHLEGGQGDSAKRITRVCEATEGEPNGWGTCREG